MRAHSGRAPCALSHSRSVAAEHVSDQRPPSPDCHDRRVVHVGIGEWGSVIAGGRRISVPAAAIRQHRAPGLTAPPAMSTRTESEGNLPVPLAPCGSERQKCRSAWSVHLRIRPRNEPRHSRPPRHPTIRPLAGSRSASPRSPSQVQLPRSGSTTSGSPCARRNASIRDLDADDRGMSAVGRRARLMPARARLRGRCGASRPTSDAFLARGVVQGERHERR